MDRDDDLTMNITPVVATGPTAERPPVLAPLAAGAYLGRYRLERALGRGGMGEVFLAEDTLLGRRVALKFILGSGTDGLAQQRLLREAQVVARLHHRNIVEVYDAGAIEGRMFLAMEFVAGSTLRTWVDEGRPDWRAVVTAVTDAASGIAAAHAAGLLHRDIKPDNVMRADDGRVLVLDFGLARAVELPGAPAGTSSGSAVLDAPTLVDARLTRAADCLCTPRYAAPELLQTGACSPATDQYAVAVMLYELLHRRPPFVGSTMDERIAAAGTAPTIDPSLTAALGRCLTRALRWDASERYPSVDAFAEALRDVCRARDRRRRRMWTAALVAGLALAAGGGFVAARSAPPVPIDDDAAASVEADAIEAASRARYVYPPPSNPEAPTAYTLLFELDALNVERAEQLRDQFATALVELGDRYWDRPGGGAFAADFYVQALLFDPTRSRAADRATLTTTALADLDARARRGAFSGGELAAGELLAAMSDADEAIAAQRVQALLDREQPTVAVTVEQRARRAVGLTRRPARATTPRESSDRQTGDITGDTTGDITGDTASDNAAASEGPDAAPTSAPEAPNQNVKAANRKTAAAWVQRGDTARGNNELATAEAHYQAALEASAGFAPALIGLSHTQFERGRYESAARRARQAIRAAPKKAGYHLQLGDACVKSGALAEARSAYETAKQLGHASADARLARLGPRAGDD